MNEGVLTRKLESLTGLARDDRPVRRLERLLRRLEDPARAQLNPVRLARRHRFEEAELLDLMVLGARVGLLQYLWKLVCPGCSFVTFTCDSLNQIQQAVRHCRFCEEPFEPTLDQHVEVYFELHPDITETKPDILRDPAEYYEYHFGSSLVFPESFQEFRQDICRGFLRLVPEEASRLEVTMQAGERYRLISLDQGWVCQIRVDDRNEPRGRRVRIACGRSGFSRKRLSIPPGKVALEVGYRGDEPAGVLLLLDDPERLHRITEAHPPRQLPHLTGKTLLNNQTFRDSFRPHNLRDNLRLQLSDLTVLFTDLKDSTDLYARRGDGIAYQLIQEHFEHAREAARARGGAIVKTMGDSVMATFSSAQGGLKAAHQILRNVRRLNSKGDAGSLRLRVGIGLHRGPVLLVNANSHLDYFGQTVNIASRVAHRAGVREIWYTDAIRESASPAAGLREETRKVRLKGVGETTRVYWIKLR